MANGKNTAYVLDRIKEPSTWAGLGLIAQSLAGVIANPRDVQAWGAALTGIMAVIVREQGAANA